MITFTHAGRIFRVLAKFDGEDRVSMLETYLHRTLHARALTEVEGVIIVVSKYDQGRLPAEPDTWDQGWTSLLDGGIGYPTKREFDDGDQ